MGDDKPEELAIQAIVRAKFCQSLGPYVGLGRKTEDLFLLGLLSLIDAFLDRPLEEILKEIPIDDEIKKALLGADSSLGNIYQFVLAYEKGEWEKLAKQRLQLGIDEAVPPPLYLAAIDWGNKCFQEDLQPANGSQGARPFPEGDSSAGRQGNLLPFRKGPEQFGRELDKPGKE